MEKKKVLLISIIDILVLLAGLIAAFFIMGGPAALRARFTSEETSETEVITEEETPADMGRPKTVAPASIIAAVFDSIGENFTSDIDSMPEMGFNTAIFDLNKDNVSEVKSAAEYSLSKGIYTGIRVADDFIGDDITSFFSENNLDFIIIPGNGEGGETYEKDIEDLSFSLKDSDPGVILGILPEFITKTDESTLNLAESSSVDFIFVSEPSGDSKSMSKAQELYSEQSVNVWMCHNLKGLDSYSTSDAQKAIDLITVSSEMPQNPALAFYPFSDISSADSDGAKLVKSYIVKKEKYLEDKELVITNYNDTNITVDTSSISFRGTSSPLHEVTCNGKKIETADNGDFSVECKLNIGQNKIVFAHKDKTYTYNVTYKIKVLKSVSPAKAVNVPGGIDVEVTAVAIKGASLSVSFNGSTYKMTEDTGSSDDSSGSSADFVNYYATLKTPEGKSSAQNLGTYKVTASYSGITESKTGAKVTVSAVEPVTTSEPEPIATTTQAPETTEAPTERTTRGEVTRTSHTNHPSNTSATSATSESASESGESSESTSATTTTTTTTTTAAPTPDIPQQYDYTKNYGKGTAKMAVITEDYVETYSGSNTSSKSVPDCSPLLKGTVDYVKASGTCDDDDDNVTYYYLTSGVKVPLFHEENTTAGSHQKITHLKIVDGYIMPKNNINVISCSNSGNKTIIKLSMNRLVAFNAKLTGQTYSSYNGRPVAVSSVDATGLEFTFSDTDKFTGSLSFMNSNIKSAAASVSGTTATLKFNFLNAGKFYGFHYEYSNGILTIVIKQKPSSISGYTIMLDPGHGGYDGGAGCVVSSSTWSEKKINLAIAQKVKEYLEKEGAKVIMTRTSDSFLSLSSRNAMVRQYLPDLFISIHCDSSSSASAYGTSAFYYRAYSQPLAKYIHNAIVSAYKSSVYSGLEKPNIDRGASFYAYRVARVEECPAVLVEYGFISNTAECQKLQDSSVRDALAKATVTGIKNYIANS